MKAKQCFCWTCELNVGGYKVNLEHILPKTSISSECCTLERCHLPKLNYTWNTFLHVNLLQERNNTGYYEWVQYLWRYIFTYTFSYVRKQYPSKYEASTFRITNILITFCIRSEVIYNLLQHGKIPTRIYNRSQSQWFTHRYLLPNTIISCLTRISLAYTISLAHRKCLAMEFTSRHNT